ncbi:MAG: TIGR01777 family oxidoreductase [Actinomycetota bacterium]
MKILISGSSGFIGSALVDRLTSAGHRVIRLVRREVSPGQDAISWEPNRGRIDGAALEGVEGVVHLAGEGIGDHRWTEQHKARVLNSRVAGTHLLAETVAKLDIPPKVMISASGVHYYGDRGDEKLTEDSGPGAGFLAGVVEQWETASEPASIAGIRVVNTRQGVVLSPKGGAFKRQLLPFKLGLGGKLASGEQYFSWITLEDYLSVIQFLLEHEELSGPVNVTSPNPVTNDEFTRALGAALGRPTIWRVPGFALKLMFSAEMAEEMLLMGQRVLPARLLDAGFEFGDPQVEAALRRLVA